MNLVVQTHELVGLKSHQSDAFLDGKALGFWIARSGVDGAYPITFVGSKCGEQSSEVREFGSNFLGQMWWH